MVMSAHGGAEIPAKSNDLKLKQQINTPDDDYSKRPKKKKRLSGHKIKIEKKTETSKGMGL